MVILQMFYLFYYLKLQKPLSKHEIILYLLMRGWSWRKFSAFAISKEQLQKLLFFPMTMDSTDSRIITNSCARVVYAFSGSNTTGVILRATLSVTWLIGKKWSRESSCTVLQLTRLFTKMSISIRERHGKDSLYFRKNVNAMNYFKSVSNFLEVFDYSANIDSYHCKLFHICFDLLLCYKNEMVS